MTQDTGDRARLIQKLLHKAEANGTTPAEREALSGKAAELMLKWGIEEAMLQATDRIVTEKIVQREFTTDSPKSYSYEMTRIGAACADALGSKGFFRKKRDGRTNLLVVGFESDVERIGALFTSLGLQCVLNLGPWYQRWCDDNRWYGITGTDKFNAKRSFISGYADGVRTRLTVVREDTVASAEPGTDLILVDRTKQIETYVASEMRIGSGRGRRYSADGSTAGHAAGMRANIGGGQLGGSRQGIER